MIKKTIFGINERELKLLDWYIDAKQPPFFLMYVFRLSSNCWPTTRQYNKEFEISQICCRNPIPFYIDYFGVVF